ncbi:uncharacterized protein LOC106013208, partial [Aplysia californica]|uniref:Uncharacterized protein LOC106013208 n=1 Tax=Aplysia californica TaxID=6500 RepID=A0ABM1AA53_APLCA
MAMFKDTIFGTVYFRQADDPGAPTVIVSDLYTSGNVRQAKWAISEDMAPCGGTYSSQYTFNPENADGTGCSTSMHSGCPVGDLGSKLGSAQLGATSHEQRVSFKDTNLPLSGGNSVRDKVLVIYSENDNSVLACSMIKPFTGRVASVRFSEQGVAGSITFSQNSPLDATQTIVSLNGLAMNAKGYHVHKWPRPIQVQPGQSMCSGDVVSGHLNPYGIDTKNNYPPPTTSTDDMYEVGDLSSKYGTFAGQSSVSGTYIDWNLPLFGRNGIVGRSVVIHRDDPAGSRWICANIEPHEEVVAAVATFKYPVIGHAVFVQVANDPSADTSISLQLDYNDGRPGSLGHRWRINANPPGDDFLSENVADRCASTGSTYNPGNLWQQLTEGQYSPYCNRMNQLSCKEG